MKDKETIEAIELFYQKLKIEQSSIDVNLAASMAIKAAVERNPTYSDDANIEKIHKTWTEELISLFDKYKNKEQTKEVFVVDVMALQRRMNKAFPVSFKNNGKSLGKNKERDKDYDLEFRIAHSQKSLSIFLKHMWCITPNMPMPPVCPIDRNILKEAKIYNPWTKLNCIKKYNEWLNKIECVAGKERLAKWELVKWNQPSKQVSDANQKGQQSTPKDEKPNNSQKPPIYRMELKDGGHYVLEEEMLTFNEIPILLILGRTPGGSHFCGFWNKDIPNTNLGVIPKIQDIINKLSRPSLKWENKPEYSRIYVMYKGKASYNKAKELKDKISTLIHDMK